MANYGVPDSPAPATVGSLWMLVDSTTEQFPSDGIGGNTTTAADSIAVNARRILIDGFVLRTGNTATSNIEITDGLGNTIDTLIQPTQFFVGEFQAQGRNGQEIAGSTFGARLAAAGNTYWLAFRYFNPSPEFSG